jgi:hypothetical protein
MANVVSIVAYTYEILGLDNSNYQCNLYFEVLVLANENSILS